MTKIEGKTAFLACSADDRGRDVAASSRWYQELLGCESGHGGAAYERLVKNGELVLQLHAWGAHDQAVARARALGTEIIQEPFVNARAQHRECWLRDPDGYVVVLAGPGRAID